MDKSNHQHTRSQAINCVLEDNVVILPIDETFLPKVIVYI